MKRLIPLTKKNSKKDNQLPKLIVSVVGSEVKNYKKQNKAMMSVFAVIEHKLEKALKESEKDIFTEWEARQTYLLGYRKALRDILSLKPKL